MIMGRKMKKASSRKSAPLPASAAKYTHCVVLGMLRGAGCRTGRGAQHWHLGVYVGGRVCRARRNPEDAAPYGRQQEGFGGLLRDTHLWRPEVAEAAAPVAALVSVLSALDRDFPIVLAPSSALASSRSVWEFEAGALVPLCCRHSLSTDGAAAGSLSGTDPLSHPERVSMSLQFPAE